MPDTDEVLAQHHEAVLLLTLNRPTRLNAWTPAMREHYVRLLAGADRDPQVRAVVVTGAGRAFCSGTDIAARPDDTESGVSSGSSSGGLTTPITMRTPVIAAINGAVAGSGLVAALFADVRFVADDARITTTFPTHELDAERGTTWLLPKLIGVGAAMDLLLSARTLRGDEAGELGLVDRVVAGASVVDAALDYAHALTTERSAGAVAAIKQQVYAGLDSGLEIATRHPRARLSTALGRTDQRRAPGSPPAER